MTVARDEDHGAESGQSPPDFAALYEEHYPRLYRTVRAIVLDARLAEDLTQDAFVQAYVKWDTYQGQGPVAGWLYRIAVNQALSYLRRPRLPALVARLGQSLFHSGPDLDPQATAADRMDITAALHTLAPQQRAVLVLYYYHGYNYREIAQALGIAEGTVGASLNAARKRLRGRLEEPGARKPLTIGDPAPAPVEITHGSIS
jgi:RNA polymerase sigma-70 factor (ECF subfamily)